MASPATRIDPLLEQYYLSSSGVVGRGGFGTVRQAWERQTLTLHALKFIRDNDRDPNATREKTLLQEVSHPNVVKLLRVFEPFPPTRTSHVLAFPAADGDLAYFLGRRGGRIPSSLALSVTHQVAQGVAHLHKLGILHRDLKPANIFLTALHSEDTTAAQWHAEVGDLGLARRRETAPRRKRQKTEVTEGGLPLMGAEVMTADVCTSWYRAPELFFCDRACFEDSSETRYSAAIDVWSVGCIVFELLAGRPLCRAGTYPLMVSNMFTVLGVPPESCSWSQSAVFQEWSQGWSVQPDLQPWPVPRRDSKDSVEDRGWSFVGAALQWKATSRPSVQQLLDGGPWPSRPAGAGNSLPPPPRTLPEPGELQPSLGPNPSRVAGTETPAAGQSAQDLHAWLCSPATERLRPEIDSSEGCACKGHCYQPGHRYHGGCSSRRLVKDSLLCILCVCAWCAVDPGRDQTCATATESSWKRQQSPCKSHVRVTEVRTN